MVPRIDGVYNFERALKPGDIILVIPDYYILPAVQEACDIVNSYSRWMWNVAGRSHMFYKRPIFWTRGHKPMNWRYRRGVRLFTTRCNDCIGLFNMVGDNVYSACCHDIYVMQHRTYESLKSTSVVLDRDRNYIDRYDLFVEQMPLSYLDSYNLNYFHKRNPFKTMDFSSYYPKVDTCVHTPDPIVEELKKQVLADYSQLFPPYKYDWGAYQNIVASREAMKRAEHGESEAEAVVKRILNSNIKKLTMPIPKVGDFELEFDKAVPYDDHAADVLRYCANDVLAIKELFENRMKEEENENMKQNNKTTENTKTLTGYVTDFTVTQTGPDEDCNTVELVLRVPRYVALSKNNYPCSLTGADINKMIHDRKLTTLTFEKPSAFMESAMCGAIRPKKVIFNNPATIVIWNDGTKTVVTRQKGDRYNKEEGLALCYMKKALGNSSRVFNDALHAGLKMGEE